MAAPRDLAEGRLSATTSAYDTTPEQQAVTARLVHRNARNEADEQHLLTVLGLAKDGDA